MDRRHFVTGVTAAAIGTPLVSANAAPDVAPQVAPQVAPDDRRHYELRVYETRSDLAPNRLRTFIKDHMLPAYARAGAGTFGAFTPEVGLLGGSLVVLVEYRSAADVLAVPRRLDADRGYAAARDAFEGEAQPPFVRYEARLMRAFAGHPAVEVPPTDASRAPRLFELRTYESRSAATLAKKIDMFDQAEIALFRSIGMTPVLFGENLFATRLPSLTYMLAFDDLVARAKAWETFRAHPEWKRIQQDPRWTADGGITTVTSSVLLNPLPMSQIR